VAIVGAFTNAFVLVNAVDLSNHGREIHTAESRAPVDVTAFGSSYTQELKGLGEASITVTFLQDFAAGSVHATLQPLLASNTPIAVEVRAVNAARSATNPAGVLSNCTLFSYQGIDGAIGDASMVEAEFRNAPPGTGISWLTS